MDIFGVISLMGGLALFLYGMSVLGTGLERLSGGRLERILERLTSNTFKAVMLGALVTAAVQSSSATTVIVVGLVNARVLKLRQAIGVIMGANIGTTVTAHILRLSAITSDNFFLRLLKPTALAPLMAIIGIFMFLACKRSFKKDMGSLLLGFGILFTGMFQMEAAVSPLSQMPQFTELFATLSNPLFGVLAGAVVTAIIQSSSASVGILQALSSTGAITFSSAFPIIMGQNIGTCITPILASIGASKNAKRSAVVHLSFNIIGTIIFIFATYAIQSTVGFPFWLDPIDKGGIANFHTVFNISVTLVLMPFAGMLEKLACFIVKDRNGESDDSDAALGLDERLFVSPGLALEHSRKAVIKLSELCKENFAFVRQLSKNYDTKTAERIRENENTINKLQDRLSAYMINLSQKELTENDSREVSNLLHQIDEFERVGDDIINIMDNLQSLYDSSTFFSEEAMQELDVICTAVEEIISLAADTFVTDDQIIAKKIEPLEQVIDIMEETLKSLHINRLRDGKCTVDAAFPFVEILSNLEKIADNCSNIGVQVIGFYEYKHNKDFDAHEYLRKIHMGDTADYAQLFKAYEQKYFGKLKIWNN